MTIVSTINGADGREHGAVPEFLPDIEAPIATDLLIDGELTRGKGAEFAVDNPATEERIATVRAASAEQVDAAARAARMAFARGEWRDAAFRSQCLARLADLIEVSSDELLRLIVSEVGTPVTTARALQVPIAIAHLREASRLALVDRTCDMGRHAGPPASRSLLAYRPVGVVAAIAAYNYPLLISASKIGGALAAGCTVVLLPSHQAPLAVLRLGELVRLAGFPRGVLNIVAGGADVGQRLTGHGEIDKLSFTGSVATGRSVMLQAAGNLTGVTLELGGKSPAIILPGTSFAPIAGALHARYLRNAGQGCGSPTRILVERSRIAEFIDISRDAFAQFKVGDPRDPAVLIGPLISKVHRDRVQRYVADAQLSGATIAAGGGKCDLARGYYMNPALVAGVTNASPIAREELFGPVGVLLPYDDIDGAVAIANDSELGLAASLFGDDEACLRIAPRLDVGTVTINGGALRVDVPLCGYKNSGVGAEGGEEGLREFLRPQHIQLAL